MSKLARKYRAKWELKFALAVSARDAASGTPSKAACLMCVAFPRDETEGSKRRKRRTRVHCYSRPWRPDNMRRHLEQQHSVRWAEYQDLTDEAKRLYFPPGIVGPVVSETGEDDPALGTMMSTEATPVQELIPAVPEFSAAAKAMAEQTQTFLVDKDVVDELVESVLSKESGGERRGVGSSHWVGFVLQNEDGNDEQTLDVDVNEARYVLHVDSMLHFRLSLKYVASGLSFKQTMELCQAAGLGDSSSLHGPPITARKVAALCRIVCAVNLQTLKDVMRSVWGFAVALETGRDGGSPYTDVRVRFERDGKLHSVHLVALPAKEDSRIGDQLDQSDVVTKCLNVVAPDWRSQLVGIRCCLNGAVPAVASCARGISGSLIQESTTLVFCDAGTAQQLDLAIQEAFNTLLTPTFTATLVAVSSYLRRQQTLVAEMQGEACPKVVEGSWKVTAKVVHWLAVHHARVIGYFEEKQPSCAPGSEWWLIVLAVNTIMNSLNATLARLQDPVDLASLESHERECLSSLMTELTAASGAIGPLEATQFFSITGDDLVVGTLALNKSAMLAFMKAQGEFTSNAASFLLQHHETECKAAVDMMGSFILTILTRVHEQVSESNSVTRSLSSSVPAAFLPNVLCKMRHQDLVNVMQQQRVRLMKLYSVDEIETMEMQHRALRRAYQVEERVQQHLDSLPASASFSEAWGDGFIGSTDCRLLRSFCGALASASSAFDTASSVDDRELALINWCKTPFTQSPTDFALEAILHTQQYCSLACIREY